MSREAVARLAVAAAEMAQSLRSRDLDAIVSATDALEAVVNDLKTIGVWHANDPGAAQLRGLAAILADAADRADRLTGATLRRASLIETLRGSMAA